MTIDYKYLSMRIASYRKNKKLSQEALADIAGITREFLAQIETGKRHPSLETVVKLANALGISADDLLVDSLYYSASASGTELHRLLLDCTETEKGILLDLVIYMKTVLYKLGI